MSTSNDVARVKRKLQKRADQMCRGLALEAGKRIVERTPVDTGRARGNWNFSIGTVDGSTTEHTDKTGTTTISKIRSGTKAAKFGDTMYIVNGLPYIHKLEHGGYGPGPKTVGGFSTQAPAGMVRVVAAELQPIADEIARKVRGGISD
jgi:hypothetical protein